MATEPAPPSGGRLYRPVDWLTFAVVTVVMLVTYLLTIAPDLTLEDSGELAVGSMYAGVPHPPGYPLWTIYSWGFTKLLPFSSMAWRVAVSSAVAAAFSAGLVALMVSRGSSLILESIDLFKDLSRRWENPQCFVSGLVSGLLIGFNGFIWSQAVIVEVYTLAVLTLVLTLVFLMRWSYAPEQRRYLYAAFFIFGLSFANHQTLIVGAMGIEVVVAMADRRLGRDLFLGNAVIWALGLLGHFSGKIQTFTQNPSLLIIFNLVGIGSAVAAAYLAAQTGRIGDRLHIGALCGLLWFLGALIYLYMPVASMTNPPMNWGYPRTAEGFIHAFTRGQYEKTTPTSDPVQLIRQLVMYAEGAREEFNWANLMIGLVPFAFLNRMQKRERGWILGLTTIYLCLAVLLLYLLNPGVDKQNRDLVKVFFTTSHVIIALAVGYGLSLVGALILTQYERYRFPLLMGAAVACAFNLFEVVGIYSETVFPILRAAGLLSLLLSLCFLVLIVFQRERARLAPFLMVFALIPFDSALSHWADNEQRHHYFGYWFGHDMFEPGMDTPVAPAPKSTNGQPLYPPMARDTVLFGGTDPGRFAPTYMIFAESFTPPEDRLNPKFDRRDVYIITQNALADNTYLDYIRAHYERSAQKDPPFFQGMLNDARSASRGRTNFLARLAAPLDRYFTDLGARIEKERRAGSSMFHPSDFTDFASLQTTLKSGSDPLSTYLREQLGPEPLGSAEALASGLNRLIQGPSLYDAPGRFAQVTLSPRLLRFAKQNPPTFNRIRLNRELLEAAYPGKIAVSLGGLYPDMEIHIPTPEEASRCFQDYTADAAQRFQRNELDPGEDVRMLPDGRVSVTGQVAVMAINGLLTKVIFDQNPDHEFYIEESFPLKWMYPHLVPYGIIMKIERNPVAELSAEVLADNHAFWSQYAKRFIGDWITYDTPTSEVADFALRTYLRRDLTGFQGDPKFVRDKQAQKAFSKLRNAQGKSIFSWRAQRAMEQPELQQRYLREAEFALKQAFAFCPYSPETVYNYASLLAGMGRYEDAARVAEVCVTFDPDNAGVRDLLRQLEGLRGASPPAALDLKGLEETERLFRAQPTNADLGFKLASSYFQSSRSNAAMAVLEEMLTNASSDTRTLISLAQAFQTINRIDKMEDALTRFAQKMPDSPEAWFDLAAILAAQNKKPGAQSNLNTAIRLSDARRARDPKARDLRDLYKTDPRFEPVRGELALP
ncbi:MAG: DUF2723 domain-containing protein [Verrucomicrobia bacterium]|nr:DUF2723 domain-containing protein [Verrucomicrobiota bacterium]